MTSSDSEKHYTQVWISEKMESDWSFILKKRKKRKGLLKNPLVALGGVIIWCNNHNNSRKFTQYTII